MFLWMCIIVFLGENTKSQRFLLFKGDSEIVFKNKQLQTPNYEERLQKYAFALKKMKTHIHSVFVCDLDQFNLLWNDFILSHYYKINKKTLKISL